MGEQGFLSTPESRFECSAGSNPEQELDFVHFSWLDA
jgi:hypothetical protein